MSAVDAVGRYALREVNIFGLAPLVDRGDVAGELQRQARDMLDRAPRDVIAYIVLGGLFGSREVARIARADTMRGDGPFVVRYERTCDHREAGVHRAPSACGRCGGSGVLEVLAVRAFGTLAHARAKVRAIIEVTINSRSFAGSRLVPASLRQAADVLTAEGGSLELGRGFVVSLDASSWQAFVDAVGWGVDATVVGCRFVADGHVTPKGKKQLLLRWNADRAAGWKS